MGKHQTLEQELIDILADSRIEDKKLYLQCGELPRDKYLILDDCFKRLGGKWNRKGYHLFEDDPHDRIQAVVETGFMPVDNPYAYHKSPESLCEEIVKQARIRCASRDTFVLEPSAGQGAIAEKIYEENSNIQLHLVEIDPINYTILRNRFHYSHNVEVMNQDFLEFEPMEDCDRNRVLYDFIIMNPPFSVEGDKDAYITHVKRAWSMLNKNGVLISIVNGGWETKTQKKYVEFREWLSDKLYSYEFIPEKTFESTSISTRIIELRKNNESAEPYQGWNSWNQWNFVLHVENEWDLYQLWRNENLPIEHIEQKARERFQKKDYNMYFPLTRQDLLDLQEHRNEMFESDREYERDNV